MDYKKLNQKSLDCLLRDFPWLWAIRNRWCPDTVYIKVQCAKLKSTDVEFFCNRQFHNNGFCEAWVHCLSKPKHDVEWVESIKTIESMGLVRVLQGRINYSVTRHIVFVVKERSEVSWITIYRPPKPDKDFLNFFTKLREL